MNAFIFWLALGFSNVRKLSLRLPNYRRKLFVVVFEPVRQVRVQGLRAPGKPALGLVFSEKRAGRPRNSVPWRRIIRAAEALIGSHAKFLFFDGMN